MLLSLRKVTDSFDMEEAKRSIISYSKATGMRSFIIDTEGKCIFEANGFDEECRFCKLIRNFNGKHENCPSVHLYGSNQAARFGGKYIFYCPVGLLHWISPIIKNGFIQGAFVGGPVLMVDHEELLLEDLIKNSSTNLVEIGKMKEYFKMVPVVKPEVVTSLSELLLMASLRTSNNYAAEVYETNIFHKNQSRAFGLGYPIRNIEKEENGKFFYPFEKEKELLSKITMGDEVGSQRILKIIIEHIAFSSGKNLNIMKSRIQELIALLSRAALEGGANSEKILEQNHKYFEEIHTFKTAENLIIWFFEITAHFTDSVSDLTNIRNKDVIYKSLDYIRRNYMKKITLEEIAKHVYLNPSYFSKLFKKEMKCTYISYLNRIRIEASKKLLRDISIPLMDVSYLVGIDDQSYFIKAFKRKTGLTPGKYRKLCIK